MVGNKVLLKQLRANKWTTQFKSHQREPNIREISFMGRCTMNEEDPVVQRNQCLKTWRVAMLQVSQKKCNRIRRMKPGIETLHLSISHDQCGQDMPHRNSGTLFCSGMNIHYWPLTREWFKDSLSIYYRTLNLVWSPDVKMILWELLRVI